MEIFPKQDVFRSDATARSLLSYLRDHEAELSLREALVFCEFPLFREEEELLIAKLVILSPLHGVLLISTADGVRDQDATKEQLEGTFNQVFARLVKVPRLRAGRKALAFNLDAILWLPELNADQHGDESIVIGFAALGAKIRDLQQPVLSAPVFAESRRGGYHLCPVLPHAAPDRHRQRHPLRVVPKGECTGKEPNEEITVNRYEPSIPRVAFGIAAVAMTAITIGVVAGAESIDVVAVHESGLPTAPFTSSKPSRTPEG